MLRLRYTINQPVSNQKRRKIVVIGTDNAVKSAILNQVINHPVIDDFPRDIQSAYYYKQYKIDNTTIDLDFFDIVDVKKNNAVNKQYIQQADYFLAIFDLTDYNSFNLISRRIDEIKRQYPDKKILLVGTRKNQNEPRVITDDMIAVIKETHNIKSHFLLTLTNALTRKAIEEMSAFIAQDLLDSNSINDSYTPPQHVLDVINHKLTDMEENHETNLNEQHIMRAAKAVVTSAQAMLAEEGVHQFEQHQALQHTLKLVHNVLCHPQSQDDVKALEKNVKEQAPGHSVKWKQFLGAVVIFLGVVAIGLSAAGIPFTAGLSSNGIFGGLLLAEQGWHCFAMACRRAWPGMRM